MLCLTKSTPSEVATLNSGHNSSAKGVAIMEEFHCTLFFNIFIFVFITILKHRWAGSLFFCQTLQAASSKKLLKKHVLNILCFISLRYYYTLYLNFSDSFYECDTIVTMFLHACCYSKDIGIKDDVIWIESNLVHEDAIRPCTDFHLPICFCCLSKTITMHNHYQYSYHGFW